MALTKLEKDMNIVQALDDEPNDVGGMTAPELKAKFDEGGAAVKEYLNDTLTPELDAALAGAVPVTRTVNGHSLSADVAVTKADVGLGNVDNTSDAEKPVSTAQQTALDLKANKTDVLEKNNAVAFSPSADYHPATKKYVDETTAAVVMGILPDKSVTSAKLADGAVTPEKLSAPYAPLVHADSHAADGSDPITPESIGAAPAFALAAYDKTVKATYPVASGQSITAGDVVDIVNGEVVVGVAVGTLPIGTVIQLNENGSPVDCLIVHQGKPSSLYDDSCNGAWVLQKDCWKSAQWNSSDVNDYENSDIQADLNSTFLSSFDSATQASIKQVKIPYRVGSSGSTVNSGVDGLSCKIFLLSGYEVGWSQSTSNAFPIDGSTLAYFMGFSETDAKRIAYLNESGISWWLRSPALQYTTAALYVVANGGWGNVGCSSSLGIRPAFILPSYFSVKVKDTTPPTSQAIALNSASEGQNCEVIYSGAASLPGITEGEVISSDGVYGVGVLDGVLQAWSKDRPGRVVTGSYLGNGSSSRFINIGFTPKAVMLTANGLLYSTGSISNGIAFYNAPLKNKAVSGQPTALEIVQSGFTAYYSSSDNIFLNSSGDQYNYIAIP